MPRVYSLTIRNRAAAVGLAIGVVGVGVILVTVGFALLAAFAISGAVLGMGVGLYRRLRGTGQHQSRQRFGGQLGDQHPLDPALEIRSDRPAIVRPSRDEREEI